MADPKTQPPKIEKKAETNKPPIDDDMAAYQEMVLFYLSTGLKTALIGWCIAVITLAYIKIPDQPWWISDQRIDATYSAGLLGGLLGSLGITAAAGKKKKEENGNDAKKEIAELKAMIAEQAKAQNYQVIRVETPIKLEGVTQVVEKKE